MLLLPALVGCPTEVPYEATDAVPDIEAPDFDDAAAATEDTSEADRYAVDSADETVAEPEFPWDSDTSSEPPEEADQLFAEAAVPNPADRDESEADDDADESEGGFGDFLDDAYSGLIDGESATDEAGAKPPAEPDVASADEATGPVDDNAMDLDELFGAAEEPAEPSMPLEENTSAVEVAPTPIQPVAELPAPKPPTTTVPADTELLDELWGDDEPAPAADPEPAEPPPPTETGRLPFDEPVSTPAPLPEPPVPEPQVTEPQVKQQPAPPTAEPTPPPVEEMPVAWPQTPRDGPPLASGASQPLPATPILPFNTRYKAWLLGSKLGLAELADLDGATRAEVTTWSREMERLANELQIDAPVPQPAAAASPAERVRGMMSRAARVGTQLAGAHGADHAALMEIALKSNALLVVAEQRPDLAGPVGAAIREAAGRATLPRFLWEDIVSTLSREPNSGAVSAAIERLHKRVESFLR